MPIATANANYIIICLIISIRVLYTFVAIDIVVMAPLGEKNSADGIPYFARD